MKADSRRLSIIFSTIHPPQPYERLKRKKIRKEKLILIDKREQA
jgi:hypothetical protein